MATRRIKLPDSAPLEAGAIYDIEGPVTGRPNDATKLQIERHLNNNPSLSGAKLKVLDWGKNGAGWVVRVRVESLPKPAANNDTTTAVAPVVIIAAALIAALAAFTIWQFVKADIYKFEQIPDSQKGLAYAGSQILLPLAVVAVAAVFLLRRT